MSRNMARRTSTRRIWAWAVVASFGAMPLCPTRAIGQEGPPNALPTEVTVMQRELARTMQELELPNREPPYYGAYWLVDFEQHYVSASLGAILEENADRGRRLRVELRVGSPSLDNSNFAAMGDEGIRVTDGLVPAPYGAEALARTLWLTSDDAYRRAVEVLDQKRAERSAQVDLESVPDDFSTQGLVSTEGPAAQPLPPLEELASLATDISRVFDEYAGVHESNVSIDAHNVTRTLVNSTDLVSQESKQVIETIISCQTQAADAMPLHYQVTLMNEVRPGVLVAEAKRLAEELSAQQNAELVDDYFGPVLFEGRAAPQIMAELLGEPLSATPRGDQGDSLLSRRVGKRILPEGFFVYDDPTLAMALGLPLVGNYLMDDEGVPSERVSVVEAGRLRGLLTSRTPSKQFSVSNGHGRSGLSGWPRGMIGNLIVEARGGSSREALRRQLLRTVKEEGGEFGLVVERLEERQYSTGGAAPPAPERVFKLGLDGSVTLVRGAQLSEMNLRDLRMLLGHGRTPHVYSYQVRWPGGLASPTSVVAPSLLFEEVELTRPKRSYQRPKVLPRPTTH